MVASQESIGEPLDPVGHIKLAVADIAVSRVLYDGVFERLGYERIAEGDEVTAWRNQARYGYWIVQAEQPERLHDPDGPGIHHLGLMAPSAAHVDDVYGYVRDTHPIIIEHPPRFFPQYRSDYYATYFYDFDRIKLEVLHYDT